MQQRQHLVLSVTAVRCSRAHPASMLKRPLRLCVTLDRSGGCSPRDWHRSSKAALDLYCCVSRLSAVAVYMCQE